MHNQLGHITRNCTSTCYGNYDWQMLMNETFLETVVKWEIKILSESIKLIVMISGLMVGVIVWSSSLPRKINSSSKTTLYIGCHANSIFKRILFQDSRYRFSNDFYWNWKTMNELRFSSKMSSCTIQLTKWDNTASVRKFSNNVISQLPTSDDYLHQKNQYHHSKMVKKCIYTCWNKEITHITNDKRRPSILNTNVLISTNQQLKNIAEKRTRSLSNKDCLQKSYFDFYQW